MKENSYDQEEFFASYRQFPRSKEGLAAAGEWETFKKLLPDFTNKKVLDIGCGFGWHCRYAAQKGAKSVLGTDISGKMLAEAKKMTTDSTISYQQIAMEDLTFPTNSFDIVISSLAFHYTPNFLEVAQLVYQSLTTKGAFIFSVEHPIFTAQGRQDWLYNEDGTPKYWPVDHYFSEGKRNSQFLGSQIVKYHRTLTTYLNTLLSCGFSLQAVVEPQPSQEMLRTYPEMQIESRRPMMLLISAVKE